MKMGPIDATDVRQSASHDASSDDAIQINAYWYTVKTRMGILFGEQQTASP